MQVPVRNSSGAEVGSIEVNEAVFGLPKKKGVVWQAMVWQRANRHMGTVDTLRRGEVSGSTRKPWRQKHTGRARAGEIRSPLWRHGGIIHGPHQRSFAVRLPRKMRMLAIRSMLSAKRADGDMIVLENLEFAEGKTKEMTQLLTALEMGTSTLVVTHGKNENVVRAGSNVEGVRTLLASQLNTGDLLRYQKLVLTVDAVREAEAILSRDLDRKRSGEEAPKPAPVTAPAAVKHTAPAKAAPKAKAAATAVAEPKADKPARKRTTTAAPSSTATARSRSARKKSE